MLEFLRPRDNMSKKYAREIEEIRGDLLQIEDRAFYMDLMYFLENEKYHAVMALKTSDSDEARAKWKFIDKLIARYDYIRKEGRINKD